MLALILAMASAAECTYTPVVWSATEARSMPAEAVSKPRSALTEAEQGPLGCTPCEQDQVSRTLTNGLSFTACAAVADNLAHALDQAIAGGAEVVSVSVYRPVLSRGPLDAQGRRTVLSDHAFGVAVDVNADHNGLYDDCVRFDETCRLLRGGPWRPGEDPRSITASSPLVRTFADIGWAWGGELAGKQKDFMHFSPR
ncbi:MAG: M15 family peptidase [Deltaproteobacteria bacterium]|nr:MAG: M15 family peptidase [Deltaproteobacteria bacterium]